jgi:hypothetical protein
VSTVAAGRLPPPLRVTVPPYKGMASSAAIFLSSGARSPTCC